MLPALCLASGAQAMEFKLAGDQLILSGRIDGTEIAKLRDFNADPEAARVRTVILRNSPGGDHWTSLRLAEEVRDAGWSTAVSGYCLSGCALVFLGGKSRHFTSDRPAGLTHIGFHGSYATTGSLRDFAGTLVRQSAYESRSWTASRTAGQLPEALLDRVFGLEERKGFLYFFDSIRLHRKDGVATFFCTGKEDPKMRWDLCEKLAHIDVFKTGVATSTEVIRSNDLPPAPAAPAATPAAPVK